MAKQKSTSKEQVYDSFLNLDLQSKVEIFKLIESNLKAEASDLKKEVHLKEESIDLLSSVIEIKEK